MKTNEILEAAASLDRVAAVVRSCMPKFVDLQPDGSGAPRMLALRDAFLAFPAPAEVLFIDGTGMVKKRDGSPHWTLIRFDLSQPGTSQVKFAAALHWEELPDHGNMLIEHFGLGKDYWHSVFDFSLVACWQDYSYMFLAPFDIRTSPEEYGLNLGRTIGDDHNFVEVFLSEVDFNAKYSLQPDPVLSAPEFLRLGFAPDAPSTDNRLRQMTLEVRQQMVRDIQLIPQVTEGVREIIRRAKKLYVYGYFEYSFFTVAEHYTYAAMEAALRARWGLSLARPTKLIHRKNGVSEDAELEQPGYGAIEWYCETHGWKPSNLLVNGRPFPRGTGMLLKWLRDDAVISDWQQVRFKKAYLPMRNIYSHLEHCPTTQGSASALRRAVEQINILFDSVPLSGDGAAGEELKATL
jgi:hypothetical protein